MRDATPLPALFVSHGSPMLALRPGPTGAFFARLGPGLAASLGTPRAVLGLSPHRASRRPTLLAAARHAALHDHAGFPAALRALRHEVDGAPALAASLQAHLAARGLAVDRVDAGDLDHGLWTVLRQAWPQAGVPVLPLTLAAEASPAALWALGEAIAPWAAAERVLVLASGSLTHNLGRVVEGGRWRPEDAAEDASTAAFRAWVQARVVAGDRTALLDWTAQAPHAREEHPHDEHWRPFYLAAGAGGLAGAQRLHAGVTHGALGMDAYAFGPGAAALAEALAAAPAAS